MLRIRFLLSAALALAMVSTGAFASGGTWEDAEEAYHAQRFEKALAIYEDMARAGDVRAAEIAGHMLFLGEALYGNAVPRDVDRAARLLSQAGAAGRPVALHLLRHINPTPVIAGIDRK